MSRVPNKSLAWLLAAIFFALTIWGGRRGLAWWRTYRQEQELADAELDEGRQREIWDGEHAAFEIETRFGKPALKALAAGASDAVAERFTATAECSVVGSANEPDQGELEKQAHAGIVEQTRGDNSAVRSTSTQELVGELAAGFASVEVVDSTTFRVLKVLRTEDGWSTKLLIAVRGRDAQSRLTEYSSQHDVRFSYRDDDQLDSDPVVASWRITRSSTSVAAGALFAEATASWGLSKLPLRDNWLGPGDGADALLADRPLQYQFQMAVEDYDGDGFLDIAIATFNSQPLLLRNEEGQRFVDVTERSGLKPWDFGSSLVGWIDIDNDASPDLIVGDRVYRNDGGRFVEVTEQCGIRFGESPLGMQLVDYDCDGALDVYIVYQHPEQGDDDGKLDPWIGDNESGGENHLWRNRGDGTFENVTSIARAAAGKRKSFAATWFFYDDDHYPDVYVANDFGSNVLLRNRGDGAFEDISEASGAADFATSMGVASGDLDNDGRNELYVANMYSKMGRRIIAHLTEDDYPSGLFQQILGSCAGNRLYAQQGDSPRYREFSEQVGVNGVGWAYAPAMVDLDGDGLLDLYATTGFMSFARGKPDG